MYTIIIVDDEPAVHLGMQSIFKFEEHGFSIIGNAYNGTDALKLVNELCPDVVISDINMMPMDGLEFMENAKKIKPDIEFIFLTGYASFEYAQKAVELGAFLYLLKPLKKEEFYRALDKLAKMLHDKQKTIHSEDIGLQRKRLFHRLTDFFSPISFPDFLNEAQKCKIVYQNNMPIHILVVFLHGKDSINLNNYISFYMISQNGLQQNQFLFGLKDNSYIIIAFNQYETLRTLHKKLTILTEQTKDYSIFLSNSIPTINEIPDFIKKVYLDCYHFNKNICGIVNGIQICHFDFAKTFVNHYFHEYQESKTLAHLLMLVLHTFFEDKTLYPRLVSFIISETEKQAKKDDKEFILNFVRIAIQMISENKAISNNPTIRKTEIYMISNYYKACSIDILAKHVALAPKYLMRFFKNEVGITINKYLANLKVDAIKILLQSEQYDIYEISEIVGFNNTQYLRQIFKKHTGITISDYQNNQH